MQNVNYGYGLLFTEILTSPLDRLSQFNLPVARYKTAELACNEAKNRSFQSLPYDSTRVTLAPIRGLEGSDYINASFVDGYKQRRAYIATQSPMPNTVEDFWRMIWELNSNIVVMLSKCREGLKEQCYQYWPLEKSMRYQYFLVDPMVEYNMPTYTLREFKITDTRDGQSRTIRQFQFVEWTPDMGGVEPSKNGSTGYPKSPEAFIDFLSQVHKTRNQFGQEGPITVHCTYGSGRTGIFLALALVLDRMREEGIVDVFQASRLLRTQRCNMIESEDQYNFCYNAALEYLSLFDHYGP
ncbi:hypothetical protein Ciccas_000821 [Cichlidogyrus casuarinus]|uniref:protein-tyrosine-phosphatase n=1 Tax=Cichlidogyrus casuarinus TaxID=1844966 RepID=A0ABD2QLU5_9PLAT